MTSRQLQRQRYICDACASIAKPPPRTTCRTCCRVYESAWRDANRERINAYTLAYYHAEANTKRIDTWRKRTQAKEHLTDPQAIARRSLAWRLRHPQAAKESKNRSNAKRAYGVYAPAHTVLLQLKKLLRKV